MSPDAGDAPPTPPPPGGAVPTAGGMRRLLGQLGPLLPLTVLSAVAAGIVGPGREYISLNYFAERYTSLGHADIHCEFTPKAEYCEKAVNDNVRVKTVLSLISPILHLFLWPFLGAVSDARGRYPVIMVCTVLPLLPSAAACAFFYYDVSLYLYFALVFLTDFPAAVVWFTYVIDRVPQGENRAAAFGILTGLAELCGLTGLIVGRSLSLSASFTASMVLGVVQTCLIVACLRESLPPEKRRPLGRGGLGGALLPWRGLRILVRDQLLARLTFVLVSAGFVDGAFTRIGPSYLLKFMEWTTHAAYTNAILGQVSIIIWLSFALGVLTRTLGEGGVLLFGRAACLTYGVCFAFSWEPWQVWLLTGTLAGPMALTLPSIAALKSKLVQDDEQGMMQSALTTVNTMAGCAAAPVFGALFETWDTSDTWTPMSGAVILLGCALTVPVVVLLIRMQAQLNGRLRGPGAGSTNQSLISMQ
mmetsp:Transcript_8928/g.25217  ORF Transcript_8928/g.25217 Transcript_8928/m.25217 type:complete len:474 (+) Transcript_8928:62-1483(+)